jgi:hypothetical protein
MPQFLLMGVEPPLLRPNGGSFRVARYPAGIVSYSRADRQRNEHSPRYQAPAPFAAAARDNSRRRRYPMQFAKKLITSRLVVVLEMTSATKIEYQRRLETNSATGDWLSRSAVRSRPMLQGRVARRCSAASSVTRWKRTQESKAVSSPRSDRGDAPHGCRRWYWRAVWRRLR